MNKGKMGPVGSGCFFGLFRVVLCFLAFFTAAIEARADRVDFRAFENTEGSCTVLFQLFDTRGRISQAQESLDYATRFEGDVANSIFRWVVAFRKEVYVPVQNPTHGNSERVAAEIDVETGEHLIEVKSGSSHIRKVVQVRRMLNNRRVNPNDKGVIVFAPNIFDPAIIREYENAGAVVIQDMDALIAYLRATEGDPVKKAS